jgi:hypothetical protein
VTGPNHRLLAARLASVDNHPTDAANEARAVAAVVAAAAARADMANATLADGVGHQLDRFGP